MATITVTPGHTYGTTDTVTSTNLNDLGSPTAALTAGSILTADIADDAITPALIADDAITTPAILDANVTFAKLTDVIDDDTMDAATDTTLATSESIKAYVDNSSTDGFSPTTYASEESVTLPNGLIMKFGTVTASQNAVTTVTFGSAFTDTVNAQLTIEETGSADRNAMKINSLSVAAIGIRNTGGVNLTVHWMVIGR
jgi:hypothetical protein